MNALDPFVSRRWLAEAFDPSSRPMLAGVPIVQAIVTAALASRDVVAFATTGS